MTNPTNLVSSLLDRYDAHGDETDLEAAEHALDGAPPLAAVWLVRVRVSAMRFAQCIDSRSDPLQSDSRTEPSGDGGLSLVGPAASRFVKGIAPFVP